MNITPYKQDFASPKMKIKPDIKEKNRQQRLVSPQESEPESLPFIDDRYEVLELIGRGGMGCVYKVFNKQTETLFAIKVLRPDLAFDQSSLRRFEQEVEATCGLTHPHLVPTLAQGLTPDGAPYLVMEYVEGEDLSTILKREGRLSSARALQLWQQVCEALTYAHEKGIIHRDIKPTNIIVSRLVDGTETARLVDFGIAKILPAHDRETHNLTETGAVFGNPYYMSPEQCLSFKVDERSDIYSLGCMMYELLTGKPPFTESNPVQVVVKHINEEARSFPADSKTDSIAEKLDGITLRCLEKNPELRYQSVQDLEKDLELVRAGKSPSKYAKKRSARPEFTRAQILAATIGVALVIQSRAISGGWSDHLVIIAILSFAGCLAFSYAAIEQSISLFKGHITPRNCWRTALLSSLAGIGSFSMLDNLYLLYAENMHWMTPYTQVVALLLKLFVFSAVVSAIGCAVFRSTIKQPVWKIGMQFAGVLCTVILISSAVLPKWTSEELSHCCTLGRMVEAKAPWVTDGMRKYAIVLYPLNKSAVYDLARSQSNQGKADAAASTLDSFIKRVTDKETLAEAHFKRARIQNQPGNARLEDLNIAIRLFPRREYFEALGETNWEMGRSGEGLYNFDKAIASQPGAVTPHLGKAFIHTSQGDYHSALQELDPMTRLEDTQISAFLLRGKLRLKMNDPVCARSDFQKITQCDSDPKRRSQQGFSICQVKIMVAYAYQALNDDANFLKKLDEARTYGYGEYERCKAELEQKFKRAGLDL